MYSLAPDAVYVFERALEDERSAARIERMLHALGRALGSVKRVDDDDIPEMIRIEGWQNARLRQGHHSEHSDPSLVFGTLAVGRTADTRAMLERCPEGSPASLVHQLLGGGGSNVHHEQPNSNRVCRSRVQFDTIYGCPHGCAYCGGGKVAVINTNVEEFVEREVIPLSEANPWQKVFMFNSSLSDTLAFEPEYGMSEILAEYYASTPDQHYLIHTKSANVDWMRDVEHRGHTIALWSVTNDTTSRVIEPGSATTQERIAAARVCQEAGYSVRVKLKPIVPVVNWRQECEQMVEQMLTQVRPENIGLCMVAWMPAAELESIIAPDLLDQGFLEAMRASAEEMAGVLPGPFPHEVRAEVYGFYLEQIRKHDPDVPVFLCTESLDMWHEFEDRLGYGAGQYACGCGPQSPPGAREIECIGAPVGCG